MLRLAIIGDADTISRCERIAPRFRNAEVVATLDTEAHSLRRQSRASCGLHVAADFDQLLADDAAFDAVVIQPGCQQIESYATRLLGARKHVLLAAPLATSRVVAHDLVAAARD